MGTARAAGEVRPRSGVACGGPLSRRCVPGPRSGQSRSARAAGKARPRSGRCLRGPHSRRCSPGRAPGRSAATHPAGLRLATGAARPAREAGEARQSRAEHSQRAKAHHTYGLPALPSTWRSPITPCQGGPGAKPNPVLSSGPPWRGVIARREVDGRAGTPTFAKSQQARPGAPLGDLPVRRGHTQDGEDRTRPKHPQRDIQPELQPATTNRSHPSREPTIHLQTLQNRTHMPTNSTNSSPSVMGNRLVSQP